MGVKYVSSKVVGVDVPHAHVHLIPFNNIEELHEPSDQTREPDHQALALIAQKLAL
jgi:diadenosine tetraphosphate (Ap4A) HIT family hydrolase